VALDLPSFGAVVLTTREKVEEMATADGRIAFNISAIDR